MTAPEPGASAKTRPWLHAAAGLGLTALFLWFAFRQIPLGEFLRTLGQVSLLPILEVTAIQLAAHALRAWRWKLMLRLSHPELRRRHAFAALMVGYAVNLAVPRGGEVARAIFLNRIALTPVPAGLSSVLTERLLDVAAMAVLFPVTLLLYQDRLERLFPGIGGGVLAAAVAAAAGLALVWALARDPGRTSGWVGRLSGRLAPAREKRIAAVSESFLLGLGGVFQRETAREMLLLTAGIWLAYVLGLWRLFNALPLGESLSLGLGDAAAITLVVAVAFALPSPGGTGTTHLLASQFLIGLFGAPPAEALAFATLVHAVSVVPALLLGAACAALLRAAGQRG